MTQDLSSESTIGYACNQCCLPNSLGFPGGSKGKESACNAGDLRFDPWVGKIPLEKGMATHSSILAWRIPWTGEPDGLQAMGSQESDTTQQLTRTFFLASPCGMWDLSSLTED